MGITQQIGASSLIKPGVIDNTAARPASPYEGQVIFQKDTDQLLVWNGTAWVIPNSPAQNPQGLELITTCTVTSTSGTSATASNGVITFGTGNTVITVANAFSSNYDNYRIVVGGGVGSTSLACFLNLGSSTTGYYGILNYSTYNVGTIAVAAVNNGGNWSYCGVATTNNINALIELNSPFLAKTTGMSSAYTENSPTGSSGSFNGFHNSAVSYSGFSFSAGVGTLTGGTMRVYGYRN